MAKKTVDREVNKFLQEWLKSETVQEHINNKIEEELHKVLMGWAKTGKINLVQRHKHKTLPLFVSTDSYKNTVCLDCGKKLPVKITKK